MNLRTSSYLLTPSHPAYEEIDRMALNARFLRNYLNYQRRQSFFDKKTFSIRARIAERNDENKTARVDESAI